MSPASVGGWLLALLLWQLSASRANAWQDYKHYKLLQLLPRSPQKQAALLQLAEQLASFADFLQLPGHGNDSARVLVAPQQLQRLLSQLQLHGLQHELLLDDFSVVVKAQRAENRRSKLARRRLLPQIDVINAFYTHAEINDYLDSLPTRYPGRAFVKDVGRSYARRPLKLLTIGNGDGVRDKPIIFIDATVHAREWIAPSMALYIIQQLLDNYEQNAALLQSHDWLILPVVNADGYEYTHNVERYHRKSRRPNGVEDCEGTDLNRNFGYAWGLEEGSSSDPCSAMYRGESAFSDPETQVVRDIMLSYVGRLKWYLTLHSYGNYILLPWGYSAVFPDNFDDMMEVADAGAMAIVLATNGIYSYGSSHNILYATSGDSVDYALGVANASVAMTMKLPASGFTGFDPAIEAIEGIVTETWTGIHAMALEVIKRY